MKISLPVLLFACLLLAGCETVNVEHYRIASAATSPVNRRRLWLTLLREVQEDVCDKTGGWKGSNTVILYADVSPFYQIELGARAVGEDIMVDLYCGYGPPPSAYRDMHKRLGPALSKAFGDRVQMLGSGAIARASVSVVGLSYEQVNAELGPSKYYDKIVPIRNSMDENLGWDPRLDWARKFENMSILVRQVGWIRQDDYPIMVSFRRQGGRWIAYDKVDPSIRSEQQKAALQVR